MCFLLSFRSNFRFIRLLHVSLLLLLFCGGVVRSQLDFFVNSGEEEEEITQAPFLTLDVEVQEEVPNGDLHEVPNGDLHDVSTGDTHEAEHGSELGDPLAENATSETHEVEALIEGEGSQNPVGGEVEGQNSVEGEDESTTLLPVFGYIDPSELMGAQVTPLCYWI